MSQVRQTPEPASSSEGRILVIEDEPTIREFLRIGLGYENYEVVLSEDGSSGLQLAGSQRWDLIILDLMLPGVDGLEICDRLRASGMNTPIVMLTAKHAIGDRVAGLNAGADDYLVKPFSFEELLARLRAVLRRSAATPAGASSSAIVSYAGIKMDRDRHEASRDGSHLDLTPKEFALLDLFLSQPRHVFSRQMILERVWGLNYFGDANVVEVHISHLRDKLGPEGKRLLRTVYGIGYTMRSDD